MVRAVRRVQDIQTKFVVIMASAKEPVRGREMAVAFATRDTSEISVRNVLRDTTNLIKMKKLCYVPHVMRPARDLAEAPDRKIARSVLGDGT